MMKLLLAGLFALFGVFAVLTIFFQLRVGMVSGAEARHPGEEEAQAVRRCRQRATFCAVCAGLLLLASMVVGALAQ